MLSEEPARSIRVLWNFVGLETCSGVPFFSINELAGVDVC